MLSVKQSADLLGVSPARVRALIAQGSLDAVKVGRAWTVREEDVLQRLSAHPHAGRPARREEDRPLTAAASSDDAYLEQGRHLYRACKEYFRCRPDAQQLRAAQSGEEASFYVAMADFFLQQRQAELVAAGVF